MPHSLTTDQNNGGPLSAEQIEHARRESAQGFKTVAHGGLLSATSITSLGHPESHQAPQWKLLTPA